MKTTNVTICLRFIIAVIVLFSCTNTNKMSTASFEQCAKNEKSADSFLLSLQQDNEIVLAFAAENNAWAKAIDYRIIAIKKGKWKGYAYYKSISGAATQSINDVEVQQDSCNALWNFIQEKQAWKIPGDNGKDFCTTEKKSNCNIYDGITWRLLMFTKDKMVNPSYYEPQFYEECCPGDAQRVLFISVANMIKAVVRAEDDDE